MGRLEAALGGDGGVDGGRGGRRELEEGPGVHHVGCTGRDVGEGDPGGSPENLEIGDRKGSSGTSVLRAPPTFAPLSRPSSSHRLLPLLFLFSLPFPSHIQLHRLPHLHPPYQIKRFGSLEGPGFFVPEMDIFFIHG
jgi:hypothetical protein